MQPNATLLATPFSRSRVLVLQPGRMRYADKWRVSKMKRCCIEQWNSSEKTHSARASQ
uniref:Scm polycomb group protein homolog 1 n=1 Tax=Homo sapiens TaxID=9606 RepID=A0ABJ7H8F3_HUMAN